MPEEKRKQPIPLEKDYDVYGPSLDDLISTIGAVLPRSLLEQFRHENFAVENARNDVAKGMPSLLAFSGVDARPGAFERARRNTYSSDRPLFETRKDLKKPLRALYSDKEVSPGLVKNRDYYRNKEK